MQSTFHFPIPYLPLPSLINIDEIHTLAETMFADMPDSEKGKEQDHLAEIDGKRTKALGLIKDGRGKYGIGK
jgi:hypothetical protein